MPGYLLHAGATIMCAHGGQAQPASPPNPRVKVMGQPVVTQPLPHAVTGCANPPPPANTGPCLTAQWLQGAARVKVMGQPVLLQDSQALCTPTGTPLTIAVTQTRVTAM